MDGDTLIVAGVGVVRLIGIDTPETVDPRSQVQAFGKAAAAGLSDLALGKDVPLEFEGRRKDRYDRTGAVCPVCDAYFASFI